MVHVPLMFLLEWREFPSALYLAGKKNLMTACVSMLLKSRASPDMIPFSLRNKEKLAIRHMHRPLFPTTLSIPSYDITPDHIPDECPACPHFTLRSPQRNHAVSWMLATLITSRTQSQRDLTLQEYIDILKSHDENSPRRPLREEKWELHYKSWTFPLE